MRPSFHLSVGVHSIERSVEFFESLLGAIRLMPFNRIQWTNEVTIASGEVSFSIIVFNQGVEGIKKQKDEQLRNLQAQEELNSIPQIR